jgi:hypothetical protein
MSKKTISLYVPQKIRGHPEHKGREYFLGPQIKTPVETMVILILTDHAKTVLPGSPNPGSNILAPFPGPLGLR